MVSQVPEKTKGSLDREEICKIGQGHCEVAVMSHQEDFISYFLIDVVQIQANLIIVSIVHHICSTVHIHVLQYMGDNFSLSHSVLYYSDIAW